MSTAALIAAWLLVVGAVTTIAFWRDKRAARRRSRRTPERTLLALVLAGGVLGGWIGMLGVRHKTLHRRFWAVQWAATMLWALLLARAAIEARA